MGVHESLTGRLLDRVLTPDLREVDPAVRGFEPWAEGPSVVEGVGTAFLTGYSAALRIPVISEAVASLQSLPDQSRGFAMEGLGMGVAVRSALVPGRRHGFSQLIALSGERHSYMLYVGLGWAFARLPKIAWPKLDGLDPMLLGLVLDGLGFHETFFRTDVVLAHGVAAVDFSMWPGGRKEGERHVAQGIGRALWFVCGGDPERVRHTIDPLPEHHRSSAWAGTGLAAAYAGGRDADGLRALLDVSGEYRKWLRQGASFAIEARRRAGNPVPHTYVAADVLCGLDLPGVARLTTESRPRAAEVDSGDTSSMERWRENIAARLAEGHAAPAHAGSVATTAGPALPTDAPA
ncbi:MAG: DUF1702 family protein [Phycicoccus sp.]